MHWIAPLILLIILEALADIFAKEWSLRGAPYRWILAITAYIAANVFWLLALKNGAGLARGAVLFSVYSAILGTLLGLLIYKETMSRIQILGIIIGIVAIALIFWPQGSKI